MPRAGCSDAAPFSGPQPGKLGAGQTSAVYIDNKVRCAASSSRLCPVTRGAQWVGRIFNQNGSCGKAGEDCTMLEFNLGAPLRCSTGRF